MGENLANGRAAVYIRVSSIGRRDRESASYQTETEQVERCTAYATARGLRVVAEHGDIDVSGAKWDRKGLDAVLRMAERREIDAVIVFRLSRLGRGLRGVLATAERLADCDVDLISVSEGIDQSTSSGRLMFNLLASFDEYERELRGEYWEGTRDRARARGVTLGPTPFGYRRGAGGVIEVDPDVAPKVVKMFERRARGAALDDIALLMGKSRNGTHRTTNAASRVIASRRYVGEFPDLPKDEELRIVTDEQWLAAQHRKQTRRSGAYPFVLRGIIRCEGCGGPMTGNAFGGGAGQDLPVYVCSQRAVAKREDRCQAPATIAAKRIEDWVVGNVPPMDLAALDDTGGVLARCDAVADTAERELARYLGDVEVRDIVGDAAWREGLRERTAARDAARDAAAVAREAAGGASVAGMTWDEIKSDPEALATYLRSAIVSLTVRQVGRGGRVPVGDRVSLTI